MTRTVLFILFYLALSNSYANSNINGLQLRPSNTTCLIPSRLDSTGSIGSERVFPNITFERPIELQHSPDGQKWFLAEQYGRVISFLNDDFTSDQTLVLDLTSKMQFTSEDTYGINLDSQQWGVSGIALHPDYENSRLIFVAYNAKPSETEPIHSYLSSFYIDPLTEIADLESENILLDIVQPNQYHHFGRILFGLDGYLYIGSGDGGANPNLNDPESFSSQDKFSLLGKILRINVNSTGDGYSIPPSNPFILGQGAPEVFAYGFRNPWRFSIDSLTGELYVGDVGWRTWEEINLIESGGNYGWPFMEGPACTLDGCDKSVFKAPLSYYDHTEGRAVIAGNVYRGTNIPDLEGSFIFGDYMNWHIWSIKESASGILQRSRLDQLYLPPTGFTEGPDGEIYFLRVRKDNFLWRLTKDDSVPVSNFPRTLSETGCVNPLNPLEPSAGLIEYETSSKLWSDGAEKKRWFALKNGTTITVNESNDFEFPPGSVLVKEFSFNNIPFETRLFVRHDDGDWGGYTYEWRADLSDADLVEGGLDKILSNGQLWTYPSESQCFECHTSGAGFSLGLETAQLNHSKLFSQTGISGNQLATLDSIGVFSSPLDEETVDYHSLSSKTDLHKPITSRARSYLHSNCSGCHRPNGSAQASIDFRHNVSIEEMNICNITPMQGDLGVQDAKILVPGDPQKSIISIRMGQRGGAQMPPIGTHIIDSEGLSLINNWINEPGVCDVVGDLDLDDIPDNVDNCLLVSNTSQYDNEKDSIGDSCDIDDDNDGLHDDVETGTGLFVSLSDTGSNPFSADSDGDGISDFDEVSSGANPNGEGWLQGFNVPIPLWAILALGLSMLGLGAVRLRRK